MSTVIVETSEVRNAQSVVRTITSDFGEVFYELSGEALPAPMLNDDYAAIALVFAAMRSGKDLHIKGRVSPSLLASLEEFQEAWALWSKGQFRPINISADDEVETVGYRDGGVFAASGGVDSTFTLVRHATGLAGRRTVKPKVAAMIHGFDIPLISAEAFDVARVGVKEVTDSLGVPLCTVKTNWRIVCKNWEWEFGAGLVSVLHQFSPDVGSAVLGADEDYGHISLPWGSNPITNPMLASSSFRAITEGGGFGRTDRVRMIANSNPEAASRMRVCWQGEVTGRNCGKCEKCIRTKLNFLAAGFEPLAFSDRPTANEISSIKVTNKVQLDFLHDVLEASDRLGTDGDWKPRLRKAISQNQRRLALQQPIRSAKAKVKAILRRGGRKAKVVESR